MKEGWHFMNENKKLFLVVVKPQLRTSSTLSARPHAWYFNNKAEVTKCCVHIMDFTRLYIPHISVYLNSASRECNFRNYKYFRKWHCKWICHSLKLWHTLAGHRTPAIISWFSPQNRICYYLLTETLQRMEINEVCISDQYYLSRTPRLPLIIGMSEPQQG